MNNQINWGSAKPVAKSISLLREGKLISVWCAGLKFSNHTDPHLLGRDGKFDEYESYDDALLAAETFITSRKSGEEEL